ncbi:MAG: dNTP triphosphohydrolase, partial [Alphaproteobacteria bacterium]|nr:dNTP triphosphohydrolase [Alphaproteobacteria bacterium]
FLGLNMTWETLEGVVKHNGPIIGPNADKKHKGKELPVTLRMIQGHTDLWLDSFASIEAQIAALSDDIAYNNHDVEDGLRAGLFTLQDLESVPLLDEVIAEARATYPEISEHYLVYEVIREMIGAMVADVMAETQKRLAALNPQSADDIRRANHAMVAFSPEMSARVEALREFLWERMYRHFTVRRMRLKVSRVVKDLYEAFMDQYQLLPDNWQKRLTEAGGPMDRITHARIVADYIAGMTDRYAIREHERLFNLGDLH